SSLFSSFLHLQYCILKRLSHILRLFLFRTILQYIFLLNKNWDILVLGNAWQPTCNGKHRLLLNMLLNRSTLIIFLLLIAIPLPRVYTPLYKDYGWRNRAFLQNFFPDF